MMAIVPAEAGSNGEAMPAVDGPIIGRVGDLPVHEAEVAADAPGEAVDTLLRQNPDLPGVIVAEDGGIAGVASRTAFLEQLSRRFGHELYLHRPVRSLLPHLPSQALIIAAEAGVEDAGRQALVRSAVERETPLIVSYPDGRRALLDVNVLLLAMCRTLSARNLENERLRREAERQSSERKTALDELRRTQDHLVQNRQLAELGKAVAGVAHEINTPVGISVTAASHLEEKTREVRAALEAGRLKKSEMIEYLATQAEAGELIVANLRRASDLLRGFKQMAADETSEVRRRFHLRGYLNDVLLSLRPILKKTPHTVTIDCPEEMELDSYPGAIAQVITNLVVNSLSHAFSPDRPGRITISAVPFDGWVEIRHADDGKGIAPDHLPRIFERFFTTRGSAGGTGLGLYIVRTLVGGRLGGDIACESRPGEGTTFIIRLPSRVGDTPPLPSGTPGEGSLAHD